MNCAKNPPPRQAPNISVAMIYTLFPAFLVSTRILQLAAKPAPAINFGIKTRRLLGPAKMGT